MQPASLEIRVHVDAELADALGACLFAAGAGGVIESDEDDGLWLVVHCESSELANELIGAVDEFRSRAAEDFPGLEVGPALLATADTSWQETWLGALEPVELASGLVLRPTHRAPAPETERTLWLEPSSVFGFGDHPTTRLAAGAVEHLCRELSTLKGPPTLLDVGTGSGVLSLLAARSGARQATGIDIDETAVEAARQNAALNGLEPLCHFDTTPLEELTGQWDVVVANIDAPTLQKLARPLLDRVQTSGVLLVTGLLEEQSALVVTTLEALGAKLERSVREGDWVLLELTPGEPRALRSGVR